MTIVTACSPPRTSIDWFTCDMRVGLPCSDPVCAPLNPVNFQSESLPLEARYLRLMREIYAILNALSTNMKLISKANSTLFGHLGSDTILFLAGIWTSSSFSTHNKANVVGYVALRHASAFLRAHVDGDSVVDFQTVLPSLLVALQSIDRQIRSAAMDCINVLAKVDEGKKPTLIYAYDQVYSNASGMLAYSCS